MDKNGIIAVARSALHVGEAYTVYQLATLGRFQIEDVLLIAVVWQVLKVVLLEVLKTVIDQIKHT